VRRVLPVASAITLGIALTSSAHAQETGPTSLIDQRVRVSHCAAAGTRSGNGRGPCQRTVGDLLAVTADALRIRVSADSARVVPRADLRRLERSTGARRRVGRGTLVGAGIGLGLGLGLALAVASESYDDDVGAFVLLTPVAGAAVGSLLGAGVGALIVSERWTRVPTDVMAVAGVRARGRVDVGLRVPF